MNETALRLALLLTVAAPAATGATTEDLLEDAARRAILSGQAFDFALGYSPSAEEPRRLSSDFVDFLESVLTGDDERAEIGRQGVHIANARFPAVDWSRAKLVHGLSLTNCEFDSINFSHANFEAGLSLEGSSIRAQRQGAEALFTGMIVKGDANFLRVEFTHAWNISLASAQIDNDFDGRDAAFGQSGQVLFEKMSVGGEARFEYARFEGIRVSFGDLQVAGRASFKGAEFVGSPNSAPVNFSGVRFAEADFERARFRGGTRFDNARFETAAFKSAAFETGGVSFTLAQTTADFIMSGAEFLSVNEPVTFSQMSVGHSAKFEKAIFCGPVSFARARITGDLIVTGLQGYGVASAPRECTTAPARALSELEGIDFGGVTVGHSMSLDDSTLRRPVSFLRTTVVAALSLEDVTFETGSTFSGAQLGGLRASRARFYGGTSFAKTQIDGEATLKRAAFLGHLRFEHASVGRDFDASGADFAESDFTSITLHGDLVTERAVFKGTTSFDSANIHGSWRGAGTKFQDIAELSRLRVRGQTLFVDPTDPRASRSEFVGEVRFDHAVLDRELDLRYATFHSGVSFRNLGLKDSLKIDYVVFDDAVSFEQAQIEGTLEASESTFKRRVSFDHAKVGSAARFHLASFNDFAGFADSTIEGKVVLDAASFLGPVSFNRARVGTLSVDATKWARNDEVNLEQFTFRKLDPGANGWGPVLDWLSNARYSPDAYRQLEALAAVDQPDGLDSEKVYMKMKLHQRSTMESFDQVLDVALEYFVFFGRKPYLAFFWSAIVILFGVALYFDPKDVQPRDTPDAESSRLRQFDALFVPALSNHGPFRPYNPLWYSLDLFLPFVKLNAANLWMPRQDQFVRRHYARVHTILGWVLVPVALASVTGLVS